MHRLPSHSSLVRFRFASLLVTMMFVSVPASLASLCYGFVSREHDWFVIAGLVVAAGLFFAVLNWMLSGRVKCPLCMVPPLLNRRCAKHRSATTFLGSHRLLVALSVLFRGSFRCPYCGEPTVMQVRERGRR